MSKIKYYAYSDFVSVICFCVLIKFDRKSRLSVFKLLQLFVIVVRGNSPLRSYFSPYRLKGSLLCYIDEYARR
ncbi:MAG: hypothetical protein JWM20_865 [Patescibacteria group bacterium]|nr:hypothetical protein [Patescibacteria group bacterium]